MSSRGWYRRHAPEFKIELCNDFRSGAIGLRSWFNRFRKLLVRYEKLERSFVALNNIAGAIIAFRRVLLKINILYG